MRELGLHGQVAGNDLVVDKVAYQLLFESKGRTKKTILAGMGEAGLVAQDGDGAVTIRNTRYPDMMPALKAMAERCAANANHSGAPRPLRDVISRPFHRTIGSIR